LKGIFLEQCGARSRFQTAPLLKEREQFLSHLLQQGTSRPQVRSVARYLIQIIRLMDLTSLRDVELEEIKNAGECWANYRGPERRRKAGRAAAVCFTYVAKKWFRFHGHLVVPPVSPPPFDELIRDFVGYLRSVRGLSSETIKGYSWRAEVVSAMAFESTGQSFLSLTERCRCLPR